MTLATVSTHSAEQTRPRERSGEDWYCEPASTVHAMADVEPLFGPGHDPCCGGGNIPKALISRGLDCAGSDLVDRGYGVIHDFMGRDPWPFSYPAWMVMNPPFEHAVDFIDRAMTIARWKVCALVRLSFLEGKRRKPWFEDLPLARVWVSASRISMPPGHLLRDGLIEPKGGAVAFCWLVLEHGHRGPAQIGWLP